MEFRSSPAGSIDGFGSILQRGPAQAHPFQLSCGPVLTWRPQLLCHGVANDVMAVIGTLNVAADQEGFPASLLDPCLGLCRHVDAEYMSIGAEY